jgi:cephalosporin hydroxylase
MDTIAQQYHDLYWNSNTWRWTFWQGIPTLKCPLDLWIYQELMWLVRPRLVIELGTWAGGTATFLANMMDLYDAGADCRIITVDILDSAGITPHVADYASIAPFQIRIRPPHPRIQYVHGDSVSEAVIERVKSATSWADSVMVIADSDHSYEHAYRELLLYHSFVTPMSWFIMEDTDGPGPREAVKRFLAEHQDFYADPQCEKFHMTFNPGGYLRRRQ